MNAVRCVQIATAIVLAAAAPASALSFLEDFESFNTSGFNPDTTPDQDWYDYSDTQEIGIISTDGPALSGSQWMYFSSDDDDASNKFADFNVVGATQLTNISFQLGARTIADDGTGSRQFVAIQSIPPTRTMVEFYVFCTDASNDTGCDFRVRFDHVDTNGQILINTSLGQSVFNVTVLPDWTQGTYQLLVNGVDDGVFPFLELPRNVGRLRIGQHQGTFPLNATLDEWFIDGAINVTVDTRTDIAADLQDFATDLKFTTPTSLFLLGLVFFAVLILAVAMPIIALGRDNTVLPALAFYAVLATLWFVFLEWWPDWIGIALIIATAALIGSMIRSRLMGIRDASQGAGLVAGSLGYFVIATALLGFSGYASETVEVPTSVLTVEEDTNATSEKQSMLGAVTECGLNIVTFGAFDFDCSQQTQGETWGKIVDVASTIFNFARTAFTFLFQLLTFQLPIPGIFNVIIIMPPAIALATVGFKAITRSS